MVEAGADAIQHRGDVLAGNPARQGARSLEGEFAAPASDPLPSRHPGTAPRVIPALVPRPGRLYNIPTVVAFNL